MRRSVCSTAESTQNTTVPDRSDKQPNTSCYQQCVQCQVTGQEPVCCACLPVVYCLQCPVGSTPRVSKALPQQGCRASPIGKVCAAFVLAGITHWGPTYHSMMQSPHGSVRQPQHKGVAGSPVDDAIHIPAGARSCCAEPHVAVSCIADGELCCAMLCHAVFCNRILTVHNHPERLKVLPGIRQLKIVLPGTI